MQMGQEDQELKALISRYLLVLFNSHAQHSLIQAGKKIVVAGLPTPFDGLCQHGVRQAISGV